MSSRSVIGDQIGLAQGGFFTHAMNVSAHGAPGLGWRRPASGTQPERRRSLIVGGHGVHVHVDDRRPRRLRRATGKRSYTHRPPASRSIGRLVARRVAYRSSGALAHRLDPAHTARIRALPRGLRAPVRSMTPTRIKPFATAGSSIGVLRATRPAEMISPAAVATMAPSIVNSNMMMRLGHQATIGMPPVWIGQACGGGQRQPRAHGKPHRAAAQR